MKSTCDWPFFVLRHFADVVQIYTNDTSPIKTVLECHWLQRKMNKMEMRVMQVILIEKPLRCNLERPVLRTKREPDLIDRASVEPTSFILAASLNMLHMGKKLERPLVLATVIFYSISIK